MTKNILDHVPGDHLLALLKPYIESSIPMTPERRAQFNAAVDALFISYPGLAARVVVDTVLVEENRDLAGSLLAQSFQHAVDDKSRDGVRLVAAKTGLTDFLPDAKGDGSMLTASQAQALKIMRAMAYAYFSGKAEGPLKLRFNPLLVGASGTGKTFLAEQLGKEMGLPLLKLTVGDWVVVGAKNGTPTLGKIHHYLNNYPEFIVHLDELDKFTNDGSGWMLSMLTEIFTLLDKNIQGTTSATNPWTVEHSARLKKSVFIVGSGTWQNVFANQVARPLGFAGQQRQIVTSDFAKQARASKMIPDELVNRFNDNWLLLEPYTEADFSRLGKQFGLVEPQVSYRAMAASGLNFRALESAATQLEIARRLGPSA